MPKYTDKNDLIFESMIQASKVPVSTEEKKALYDAYHSLMKLASKTRQSSRAWDVRMLPIFTPKIPKGGSDDC
tara:strand:+ start:1582 stop:1800 length:219 start_codon:yes stop_codon:yes gene_type:complete